jgi:hypothetical protein
MKPLPLSAYTRSPELADERFSFAGAGMASLRWLGLVGLLAAMMALGCSLCGAHREVPSELNQCRWLDLDAPPGGYPALGPATTEGLNAALIEGTSVRPAPACPLNVLVLDGGGTYSAFHVGFLVGWTETGTRPTFDVVTGISSGALIAPFAFLGPKYDATLERVLSSKELRDPFGIHPVRNLIRYRALGSGEPLKRLIDREINEEVLADLRQAHQEGRHLFIATANLKTRRLVTWDLGAIACSGRPDAGMLVRKLLLASSSFQGVSPPVAFDVEVDGRCYREEHSDAGPLATAFLRFGPMPSWPAPGSGATGWLQGSNLYLLVAGPLYPPDLCAPQGLLKTSLATFSASISSINRSNVESIHHFCAVSGMKFQMLSLPADYPLDHSIVSFVPDQMPQMFECGRKLALEGAPWRHTPPGSEPGEEETPRAGFRFVTLPRSLGESTPVAPGCTPAP